MESQEPPELESEDNPKLHFESSTPYALYPSYTRVYTEDEIKYLQALHDQKLLMDVNGPINKYRDTALHAACAHRNKPMIRFLLDAGADINAQRWTGDTPFARYPGLFGSRRLTRYSLRAGEDGFASILVE